MLEVQLGTKAALVGLYLSLFRFSAQASPLDTQMQYGGTALEPDTIISKTAVTIITVTERAFDDDQQTAADTDFWPTSSVPGMNMDELISYEMGHNFDLHRVAASKTQPQPHHKRNPSTHELPSPTSSLYDPYALFTPEEEDAWLSSIVHREYSRHRALKSATASSDPEKSNSLAPRDDPIVPHMGRNCEKSYFIGNVYRRTHKLIIPPHPFAPRAEHHAFRHMIASLAAPYAQGNDAIRSANAAAVAQDNDQHLTARQAAGFCIPPQQPGAPYGAVYSTTSYALYTDRAAYDSAYVKWANENKDHTCWEPAPMFVPTTTKGGGGAAPPAASTAKPVAKTSKKFTNFNPKWGPPNPLATEI